MSAWDLNLKKPEKANKVVYTNHCRQNLSREHRWSFAFLVPRDGNQSHCDGNLAEYAELRNKKEGNRIGKLHANNTVSSSSSRSKTLHTISNSFTCSSIEPCI